MVKVRQGKSMTRARDVEFVAAGVGKTFSDDKRIVSVSIAGNVIDHAIDADPNEKPKRIRVEIDHDDPMLTVYIDALVAMRDRDREGESPGSHRSPADSRPDPPLMHPYTRLHTKLPRTTWKLSMRVTQAEAAIKTSGNTDKFMNGDYWVFGEHGFKPESQIPVGALAVHYQDSSWWMVEKVKT